ncbi:MAG TPA: MqnA/MqnD/SBP family protein [Candidatus Nitrosopolaris sp.]
MSRISISVGHTPDADDAFMFYGIASGKVRSPDFKISHVIEDIETLNKYALKHELDVTAVSAHAYAYLKDYIILLSGGSFGINYGPIVVSKTKMSRSQLRKSTIAIPGTMTSANLLLRLVLGKFKHQEICFQTIPKAVLTGKVDAGLIIHEAQITYASTSLYNVLDLGHWWNTETNGMPLPLGINIASRRSMTTRQIKSFNDLLKSSIRYSFQNMKAAIDYSMTYGRGNPRGLISKFIKMYVNQMTVDMGKMGVKSIEKMFEMAKTKGILPDAQLAFS